MDRLPGDSLLLHACCGPCSTVAVPYWRAEGLEPLALFANPNIQPDVELQRRCESMMRFADAAAVRLIVDDSVGLAGWTAAVGREWHRGSPTAAAQPEERCRACVRLRLRHAAETAAAFGLRRFSTSLSVSPYQAHGAIAEEGRLAAETAGVEFVYADLRRHYGRSIDESRRLGLYRQPYCGCTASKWEAWLSRLERRDARRARSA